MKLVKSLLLGSAAGLCAVAGAQAADLPVRKAAPVVEFVRVCSAYGNGFFFIPGTDTCLRVGGRARFEYQAISNRSASVSDSGFRSLGRLNLDARTQTAYGTLRTFVRFEAARRTGNHFSGTGARKGEGELATGIDFQNQAATYVTLDKAFIQFAGMTAGRATSFFDFFGNEHTWWGINGSSRDSTNLLAYTASFGQGFSATISMEDPVERRFPLASGLTGQTAAAAATVALQGGVTGAPGNTVGQQQLNNLPDFVGTLRVDQAWGSAQLSGAVHQIGVGSSTVPASGVFGTPGFRPSFITGDRPDDEYGFAVQGGVKLNLPFIAAGDNLYLQAAYGRGATDYAFGGGTYAFGQAGGSAVIPGVPVTAASTPFGGLGFSTSRFPVTTADGIIDPFRGEIRLSESFSAVASFLHYWTPQVRQAIFGSYAGIDYPTVNVPGGPGAALAAARATQANTLNSGLIRDFTYFTVGTNLIYSPVRDLDIGVEVMYDQTRIEGGRVTDFNRCGGVSAAQGCAFTTKTNDTLYGRFRVQRDF